MPSHSPCILSIETSTPVCSVALHRGPQLLSTLECHVPRSHSETIAEMAKKLLHLHAIKPHEVAMVAVSAGPGSYTGLRIGVSFGKGFSYGIACPLALVNSLEILLEERPLVPSRKGPWGALLDARQGRAYALIVDEAGGLVKETHPCVVDPDALRNAAGGRTLTLLGSGADAHFAPLTAAGHDVLLGRYPRAAQMGSLAYKKWQQQQFAEVASAEPNYLSARCNPPLIPSQSK